jgi:hypothetical protein
VEKRQKRVARFSMNDWVVEAIVEKLDGVRTEEVIPAWREDSSPGTKDTKTLGQLKGELGLTTAGELQTVRAWMPEITRIRKIEDEGVRREELEQLIPPEFSTPKGFWSWEPAKMAKYLDQYCPLEG